MSPDDSPRVLADKLADHFNRVTNLANPLTESDIPKSASGAGLIPQLM